ncbi:hypothetical protein FOL47_010730 [Perkinsus chesapeaki]|uniref:Calcineurin-like phosphoesterase domain-containing protein n=1 Tax=Perkinsus chesapeaki TaxID=330153 RepID=A0A7J6L0T1_PERCH|nr:hypothetical protein FOL47_010730 [Perkinsus chesapeaki]
MFSTFAVITAHCACALAVVVALKGCSSSSKHTTTPSTTTSTTSVPLTGFTLSTDVLGRSFDPLVISWPPEYASGYEIEVAPKDQLGNYLGRLQTSNHPSGNATLNLANARSGGYEVRLQTVGGSAVLARREVTFGLGNDEATQGHLTLEGNGSLRVNWVSGSNALGRVMYKSGPGGDWVESRELSSPTTYSAGDMCDEPAKGQGWRSPGYFHSVVIPNEPNLTLTFGSDDAMSREFKPLSAIPPGDTTPHSVALFGDLGLTGGTTAGGARGYGKLNFGEWPSLPQSTIGSNDNIRLGLLIGDVSYANGFLILWDQFGAEAEASFAMSKPVVVSVGNHEWGSTNNPETWKPNFTNNYFINDAGGECGVPFRHRYPRFNSTGGYAWWFSFDHGLVHYAMMSSEHDFTNGSIQHNWLREDLSKVDRNITPWVVVTCHRPVYQTCSQPYLESGILEHMQSDIAPLLDQFDVDLFVAGHWHRYERTTRISKTFHTIIGSPRYTDAPCEHANVTWSAKVLDSVLGYTEMKVSSTEMKALLLTSEPDERDDDAVGLQRLSGFLFNKTAASVARKAGSTQLSPTVEETTIVTNRELISRLLNKINNMTARNHDPSKVAWTRTLEGFMVNTDDSGNTDAPEEDLRPLLSRMTVWDLVEVLDIMATHSQGNAQVKRYHVFLTKFAESLIDLQATTRAYSIDGNAFAYTTQFRQRETFTPDICVAACHALVTIGIHVRDTLNMTSYGSDPEGKFQKAQRAAAGLYASLLPASLSHAVDEADHSMRNARRRGKAPSRLNQDQAPKMSDHGRRRLLYTIALLSLQPELPELVWSTIANAKSVGGGAIALHDLAKWCVHDLVKDEDLRSKSTTIFSLGVLSRLGHIPQKYPHQQWPDKSVELPTTVRRSLSELDVSRSLEGVSQPQYDQYQLDRQVKVVDLVRLSIGLELLQIPTDTSLVAAVEREVSKAAAASTSAISGAVPALWWTTQIARRVRYHMLPLWHRQCLNDIDRLKKTDRWKATLALISTLNSLAGSSGRGQPLWDDVDSSTTGVFGESDMNFLQYVLSHNSYQMRHREQVSWEVDMLGVKKKYFKNPSGVIQAPVKSDDDDDDDD